MKKLAETYWSNNNANNAGRCRISWVVIKSEEYFFNGGKETALEKEQKLCRCYFNTELKLVIEKVGCKIKLLDVGSCYNPFKTYTMFEVTALDIAPASDDVYKCDFLNIQFGSTFISSDNTCTQLENEGFDIVVFSLVLEYLPSSNQRFVDKIY